MASTEGGRPGAQYEVPRAACSFRPASRVLRCVSSPRIKPRGLILGNPRRHPHLSARVAVQSKLSFEILAVAQVDLYLQGLGRV